MKAKDFKRILEICSYYSRNCSIDFENKEIVGNFQDLSRNFNNHLGTLKSLGANLVSSCVIQF